LHATSKKLDKNYIVLTISP